MTTIISSQRHIDWNIVEEKMAQLEASGTSEIVLKAWDVQDYDCAVLSDGHHTYEAAKELGINVRFELINHPENLRGDNLLEQAWNDSDWYNVKTGKLFF